MRKNNKKQGTPEVRPTCKKQSGGETAKANRIK